MVKNYLSWVKESQYYLPSADTPRTDRINGGPDYIYFDLLAYSLSYKSYMQAPFFMEFDNYYDGQTHVWLSERSRNSIAKEFSEGDHDWICFTGEFDTNKSEETGEVELAPKDQQAMDKLKAEKWQTVEDDVIGNDDYREYMSVMKKLDPLTDSEKKERSLHILKYLKENAKEMPDEVYLTLSKLLTAEHAHEVRGTVHGKKYGI